MKQIIETEEKSEMLEKGEKKTNEQPKLNKVRRKETSRRKEWIRTGRRVRSEAAKNNYIPALQKRGKSMSLCESTDPHDITTSSLYSRYFFEE
jgi:hypothetical protein